MDLADRSNGATVQVQEKSPVLLGFRNMELLNQVAKRIATI